ncbi:MAG: nitroreductase family protein, partial [Pirellula sp.]
MKTPKDYPTPSVTPAELLGALQWRYAVKRFAPDRKIGPEVWSAIEESLVLTPSSFGLQPWRFVVVTDAELKAQLPAVSW